MPSPDVFDPFLERLKAQRWFRGKARRVASFEWLDGIAFEKPLGPSGGLGIVRIAYESGEPEAYLVPLVKASGVMPLDGEREPAFQRALLEVIATGARHEGRRGQVVGVRSAALEAAWRSSGESPAPRLLGAEQSNTSVAYGEEFVLKLFRKVEPGVHPEVELGRFLAERGFEHTPAYLGHLEYRPSDGEAMALGVLQAFVPNGGNAWEGALAEVRDAFAAGRAAGGDGRAALLGRRTAELHLALASSPANSQFAPEPFHEEARRELAASVERLAAEVFADLERKAVELAEPTGDLARRALSARGMLLDRVRAVLAGELTSLRIRCHGDYHLGQVLRAGDDFLITDFEGEVTRPLAERRRKSSPLRDVAGMLRSYHYAAYAALFAALEAGGDRARLESAAREWHLRSTEAFLKGYLAGAADGKFLPASREEQDGLLAVHLIEKAFYEVGYELSSRPAWLRIPLEGLLDLVDHRHAGLHPAS